MTNLISKIGIQGNFKTNMGNYLQTQPKYLQKFASCDRNVHFC